MPPIPYLYLNFLTHVYFINGTYYNSFTDILEVIPDSHDFVCIVDPGLGLRVGSHVVIGAGASRAKAPLLDYVMSLYDAGNGFTLLAREKTTPIQTNQQSMTVCLLGGDGGPPFEQAMLSLVTNGPDAISRTIVSSSQVTDTALGMPRPTDGSIWQIGWQFHQGVSNVLSYNGNPIVAGAIPEIVPFTNPRLYFLNVESALFGGQNWIQIWGLYRVEDIDLPTYSNPAVDPPPPPTPDPPPALVVIPLPMPVPTPLPCVPACQSNAPITHRH